MPFVRLEGLQFHSSWNLGPEPQAAFIEELSGTLRGLPAPLLRGISFIDIGGGYWPPQGEWLRPGGTPAGRLRNILSGEEPGPRERYILASAPLEEFAASISRALEASLPGEVDCDIYLEPGRWLCHGNMHLLMSVVDVKAPDIVITDAGTNAVGWERFEHDWFPVVNLSRPSPEEHDMLVLGSLCTPHDVWGWSYHGEDIRPGDLLMIPFQGAYTFSLRQEFIKPLPSTVPL